MHNEIIRTREDLFEKIQLNTIRIEALNESLGNRIDEVDEKLTNHIDAVAADLKSHRADTEAHHGIYQIKGN